MKPLPLRQDVFPDASGADSGAGPSPPQTGELPSDDPQDASPSLPPPPDEPDLVALRRLMFQRELLMLDQINARLSDPGLHSKEISSVVAEALLLRSRKDDKLERVLEPLVGSILTRSFGKNRASFANALFPIMGPAIRRSIAETFRSMLEGFNKSIEMSFSWKGLRWRLEALRTGKPFSEVVLMHTLVYRVEQIFLIHASTGLVLTHIVGEGVESQDADMVSAMLTAIQDFVRDCFASGGEGSLEQLQLGEFTILVEKHPLAYLACVVRGTPPIKFRETLRSSLDLILVDQADVLENYNGDNEPFLAVRGLLDDCLESKFVEEGRISPIWIRSLLALLLLLMAAGTGMWLYARYTAAQEMATGELLKQQLTLLGEQRALLQRQQHQFREKILDILSKEPGVLVLHVNRTTDQPWRITCLHDKLARSIPLIIQEAGGRSYDFDVVETPYDSFDPEIVALRVQEELRPPEGTRMKYTRDGTLTFSGSAPLQWILQIKRTAKTVPGIKELVITDLKDSRLDTLFDMVRMVESSVVEFPLGKDVPIPVDLPKLKNIVDTLSEIEHLAGEMGIVVSLAVYGYADASGNDKRNFELSQARARTLASMLYARGSKLQISVYGIPTGTGYDQQFRRTSSGELPERRLELRIRLTPRSRDVFELLEQE